jgi:hypothetical protein
MFFKTLPKQTRKMLFNIRALSLFRYSACVAAYDDAFKVVRNWVERCIGNMELSLLTFFLQSKVKYKDGGHVYVFLRMKTTYFYIYIF